MKKIFTLAAIVAGVVTGATGVQLANASSGATKLVFSCQTSTAGETGPIKIKLDTEALRSEFYGYENSWKGHVDVNHYEGIKDYYLPGNYILTELMAGPATTYELRTGEGKSEMTWPCVLASTTP